MVAGGSRLIGRYRLLHELGAGGFATVYRAHDPVLDREVAVKVLHPHLARDPATRARFVDEGRALARIRHLNIVAVFDAGQADGLAYLAMELVEGPSLARVIDQRGPLPLARTAQIVAEIAAALAALHAGGLIHCDVKPANILLDDERGRAVLLDLGVARTVDDSTAAGNASLLGTPAYMAPEQIEPRGRVSARTDVYQLGATVYAMLAGAPPYTGEATRVLYAVVHAGPPDLTAAAPNLSPAVADVVAWAMATDPARRPTAPGLFAEALRREAARPAGPPPRWQPASHSELPTAAGPPPSGTTEAVTLPLRAAHSTGPMTAAGSRPAGSSRLPAALLASGIVALVFAVVAVAAVMLTRGRDGGGDGRARAPLAGSSVALPEVTPPAATPASTPQPAAAPPTRPPATPAATPRGTPPSASDEPVSALLRDTMVSRGFTPVGPVVEVETGDGVLSVQRGESGGGQQLFIFLAGRFLGTDWPEPSLGVLALEAAGPASFSATYANYEGRLPVTVTFAWSGGRLRPDQIAPGTCQAAC